MLLQAIDATPITSWIPPNMFAYNPQIGLNINKELSREALEKTGNSF